MHFCFLFFRELKRGKLHSGQVLEPRTTQVRKIVHWRRIANPAQLIYNTMPQRLIYPRISLQQFLNRRFYIFRFGGRTESSYRFTIFIDEEFGEIPFDVFADNASQF